MPEHPSCVDRAKYPGRCCFGTLPPLTASVIIKPRKAEHCGNYEDNVLRGAVAMFSEGLSMPSWWGGLFLPPAESSNWLPPQTDLDGVIYELVNL